MDKMQGIVCFDLDGTLLYHKEHRIPDSALSAVNRLREHYRIVISTGRDMDSHYSIMWRDMLLPDAIIHLNGTKISVGPEVIFEHFMDDKLLKDIYDLAINKKLCFGTTIGEEDFYTDPKLKSEADAAYFNPVKRNYHQFSEIFDRGLKVHALSFAGDVEQCRLILREHFPKLRLCGFESGKGADVVEEGCSKAEGLKRLCEHFDVDIADTYAFGDSQNDIEIIEAAGTGIAMGNAVDELKAVADLVAEPIWDDGIYKACKELKLI